MIMTLMLFDIMMLTTAGILSIIGAYKGLFKLVLGILGFFTSVVAAYFLSPFIQQALIEYFSLNLVVAVILSGIIAYFLSLIAISFFTTKLAKQIVSSGTSKIIDHLLGGVAGLITGVVICLALFSITAIVTSGSYFQASNIDDIIAKTIVDKYPLWLKNSLSTKYLDQPAKHLIILIPDHILQAVMLPKITQEPKVSKELSKIFGQAESMQPHSSILPEELQCALDELVD